MAEKKNVTRAQALDFAYAVITGIVEDGGFANAEDNHKAPEVLEVLENMSNQLKKPRAKVVSKARKMNENLAATIVAAIPAEGTNTKGIVGMGYPDVTTTQKAAAVMRVAEDMGLVRKEKDGKNITYVPVTEDAPEDTPEG